jgi:hypothetical protein
MLEEIRSQHPEFSSLYTGLLLISHSNYRLAEKMFRALEDQDVQQAIHEQLAGSTTSERIGYSQIRKLALSKF